MKNRIAVALALCGLLACFSGSSQSQPPPSEYLTQTEIQELKACIVNYLTKKVGAPPKLQQPKLPLYKWALQVFEPAAKAKNTKQLYQLIHGFLPVLERMLQSKDAEERRGALVVLTYISTYAIDDLNDKWLAPKICEAYTLPNVMSAHLREGKYPSVTGVLMEVGYVYRLTGETEKYLEIYKFMLSHESSWGSDNSMDACRVRIAVALDKLGRQKEAIEFLEAIDPKGSLSGSRDDLLKSIKKKLPAKDKGVPK